ncbi:MAG: murein biosynthesis integral membrane protein MurJ [Actinobacteria bacterium]|nr:murein biosynthesis integral membrane protein MurJ [Actinomycetota bacterium]
MSRPLGMGAAAMVVSASVLLSRILGLGREALLATFIGVTEESTLYFDAFLIPDLLNYLLAGAYLTITLIPILSRHLERGDPEAASRAFTSVFRFVAWAIVALTALLWVLAEPLVALVFPEIEAQDRLVSMTRLVLPAQIFFVLGAMLMAVQYAHRRFTIPALAPVVYNLGIIGGGLTGALLGDPSPEAFLVGAVVGAALGNFALQWVGARRTGTWLTPVGKAESAVGEYLVLALPLMLGQSVAVLDEQFVRIFGQVEETATAALSFARRLNMVPIGVIAQAAGVAAFPFLARLAERDDDTELVAMTSRAMRNTFFIAAAATAALVVLARPLVRLIYQYGRFEADDAGLVAGLLVLFAFSVPAWGVHQILARHFYAKRKMWTPVLVGTLFTMVAIPVWLWLYDLMGVEGFALASTLVMSGYAVGMLLAWGYDSGWQAVRSSLPAMGRGAICAGAAALLARPLVEALFDAGELTLLEGIGAATVGGTTVLAAFLGVALLLRAPELADIAGRRASRVSPPDGGE